MQHFLFLRESRGWVTEPTGSRKATDLSESMWQRHKESVPHTNYAGGTLCCWQDKCHEKSAEWRLCGETLDNRWRGDRGNSHCPYIDCQGRRNKMRMGKRCNLWFSFYVLYICFPFSKVRERRLVSTDVGVDILKAQMLALAIVFTTHLLSYRISFKPIHIGTRQWVGNLGKSELRLVG